MLEFSIKMCAEPRPPMYITQRTKLLTFNNLACFISKNTLYNHF